MFWPMHIYRTPEASQARIEKIRRQMSNQPSAVTPTPNIPGPLTFQAICSWCDLTLQFFHGHGGVVNKQTMVMWFDFCISSMCSNGGAPCIAQQHGHFTAGGNDGSIPSTLTQTQTRERIWHDSPPDALFGSYMDSHISVPEGQPETLRQCSQSEAITAPPQTLVAPSAEKKAALQGQATVARASAQPPAPVQNEAPISTAATPVEAPSQAPTPVMPSAAPTPTAEASNKEGTQSGAQATPVTTSPTTAASAGQAQLTTGQVPAQVTVPATSPALAAPVGPPAHVVQAAHATPLATHAAAQQAQQPALAQTGQAAQTAPSATTIPGAPAATQPLQSAPLLPATPPAAIPAPSEGVDSVVDEDMDDSVSQVVPAVPAAPAGNQPNPYWKFLGLYNVRYQKTQPLN